MSHSPSLLKDQKCVSLPEGAPALTTEEEATLLGQVPGWHVGTAGRDDTAGHGNTRRLHRQFQFKTFVEAIAFVNRLAAVAESEQHHPDFAVHYNKVDVMLWTHTVGGLSANDFILAAKLDLVPR